MPLDRYLRNYFKHHRAVGSKDRKEICENIYGMMRWKGALESLAHPHSNWEDLYAVYQSNHWKERLALEGAENHERVSFPKTFYTYLIDALGKEKGEAFCLTCNTEAPTTLRVNTLKTTREDLMKKWEGIYDISPTVTSPNGITFHRKINFFGLPEFKDGLFEVQDEGSQLLTELMEVQPGDQVLDYCSGSGGKTLAFAPAMGGKGQIYLHDIRATILQEAKKRLKRAGIQNGQFLFSEDKNKGKLKKKMDWVLVDAPCSGTGTLRRNPDMKWRFDEADMTRLVKEQRTIFEFGLTFLKKEGKIVYCTCSVLPQENEEQIAYFEKTHGLHTLKTHSSFPTDGGMDGFFGAVLTR